MTKELHVNCIIKPHPLNAHEHITHIGNRENDWMLTRETAISRIDNGTEAYYTIDFTTGKRMHVGVVRGDGYKQPYLRTHADGKWNDNLLAQQQCDASCRLIA